MVAVNGDDAIPLHLAQLVGHSAAVNAQVIRQLLTVEGDIECPAAVLCCLKGQIAEQPAPDALGAGVQDAPGQAQAFPGGDGEHIADQPVMEAAGVGADGEHALGVQKQYRRRLCGNGADHQLFAGQAGVVFRKDLPCAYLIQNAAVAPDIIILDGYAAGEHHAHGGDGLSLPADELAPLIGFRCRLQAAQHALDILRRDAPEQIGLGQKKRIHFTLLVVMTTYLLLIV